MRIRSIKPEFWRSSDISVHDLEDRLLFIGLWSYVDDNGVGRDSLASITADLFADDLERDPRETFARVHRGLAHLSETGRIVRYEADGKQLLYISNWDRHQKIDRPSKPRYHLPTRDDAHPRETLAPPSRDPIEGSLRAREGAGEQGNRGTGDSAYAEGPSDALASRREISAQPLVAEWIEHCNGQRPPRAVVGQIAKQISAMLAEGIPYDDVRNGLGQWQTKGLHPSALPSVVHEIRTARPTVGKRQQESDDQLARMMARAQSIESNSA